MLTDGNNLYTPNPIPTGMIDKNIVIVTLIVFLTACISCFQSNFG